MLLIMLGAIVASCSSGAQVAQRNSERCEARGYQPKTDAFDDCVTRIDSERSVRMESRRLEMLDKTTAPPLLGGR